MLSQLPSVVDVNQLPPTVQVSLLYPRLYFSSNISQACSNCPIYPLLWCIRGTVVAGQTTIVQVQFVVYLLYLTRYRAVVYMVICKALIMHNFPLYAVYIRTIMVW